MHGPTAQQLLLCRVALLESTLVQHGVAVPAASAATRAACAVDAADEGGRTAAALQVLAAPAHRRVGT